MTNRSFTKVASPLCIYFVVCVCSPAMAQQLSCDELYEIVQQKDEAHATAEAELADMQEMKACLKGLQDAFERDPSELPEVVEGDLASCSDDDAEPTPESTEVALENLQDLIKLKRTEVGDLLLGYEEEKQRYLDGCG